MKTARGRGGCAAPRPGRTPGGANGIKSSAASSSSASCCDGVNSAQVATNDRKHAQHTNNVSRGQRLKTSATAEAKPSHATAVIAPAPASSQKRLGALTNPLKNPGTTLRRCLRYSATGEIPFGPASACPSTTMQRNARTKMSPTPRSTNQRGQRRLASPAAPENSFVLGQSRAGHEREGVSPTAPSVCFVSLVKSAATADAGFASSALPFGGAERSEASWRRFLDTESGVRGSLHKGKFARVVESAGTMLARKKSPAQCSGLLGVTHVDARDIRSLPWS